VCLYIYIHSFLSICFSASLAKKKEKRTRKRGHQARGASVHTAAIERSQQQHRKTPQPGSSNSPSAHSLYLKVSMKKKNYATRLSNLPRAHSLYLKVLNKKKAKKSRHQARATRRVHTASILRSQQKNKKKPGSRCSRAHSLSRRVSIDGGRTCHVCVCVCVCVCVRVCV
jgi:hypothetical protein